MTYRLIASDLDGTLLRSDGSVSERTVRALQSAEAAGLVVVIASGRPSRWMRPVAAALGHTGMAICANGAVVYDMHTDSVAATRPLSRATVLQVAGIVRAAIPGVAFAIETAYDGFAKEPGYRSHYDDVAVTPRMGRIEELAADDVVKLLVRHEHLDPDDLLVWAKKLAGDLVELTHSSRSGLLEVSAAGVTKASTLSHLAGDLKIGPHEVIAFGDMPNDLPMLAWAGAGYAVANAHADVLGSGARAAPPNDEDGVAQVIERVLAEGRATGGGSGPDARRRVG